MSTTGLWIVTGIEGLLILGMGVFTYFGLGGITRIVTKTGAELTQKVTEISTKIPEMIEEAIKNGGASMADAAKSAATSQVSNLENQGKEMATNVSETTATFAPTSEKDEKLVTATATFAPTSEKDEKLVRATQIRGGGKQTKGNKPKKIRKPRTKKNIKKVGNQMYMNFSI